jgi:uncharacterized membrane protein (DUF4010 family)
MPIEELQLPGSTEPLLNLGLALVVGLIIGLERGWKERTAAEGKRIAGVRTFGLIGLLGGLWALLADAVGPVLFGFAFLAFALLMAISHYAEARDNKDYGVTTLVAALIAFALGALTVQGERVIAAAVAVVTAVLLSAKPTLHRWLERMEAEELDAALKLLLISVVILPILPNQNYGPFGALNPYEIWWLVVLIAALSFIAYAAIKISGPERGILLTSVLGGLASSTAVSLHLARLSATFGASDILASGVLVASATMFVRVLVVLAIIDRQMSWTLAVPFLTMAGVLLTAAAMGTRKNQHKPLDAIRLRNPLELSQAVKFGVLLTVILVLSEAFRSSMGQAGIYTLAAVAGLADVDAMTLSLARMSPQELPLTAAVLAAMIVTTVNTITKGVMVRTIGGKDLGWKVLGPMALALAAGGIVYAARS